MDFSQIQFMDPPLVFFASIGVKKKKKNFYMLHATSTIRVVMYAWYTIHIRVYTAVYTLYKPNSAVVYANFERTQKAYTAAVGVAGILIFAAVKRIQQLITRSEAVRSMLNSQATEQSESIAASQASSSTKSSADHRKYYDLLVKRREEFQSLLEQQMVCAPM